MRSIPVLAIISLIFWIVIPLGLSFCWLKDGMRGFLFFSFFLAISGVFIGRKYLATHGSGLGSVIAKLGVALNVSWVLILICALLFVLFWGGLYGV